MRNVEFLSITNDENYGNELKNLEILMARKADLNCILTKLNSAIIHVTFVK